MEPPTTMATMYAVANFLLPRLGGAAEDPLGAGAGAETGEAAGVVATEQGAVVGGPQRSGFPAKSAAGKLCSELGTGPERLLFCSVSLRRVEDVSGGMEPEKELF